MADKIKESEIVEGNELPPRVEKPPHQQPKMFLQEYEATLKEIVECEDIFCLADFDKIKFGEENALGFLQLITKTRDEIKRSGREFDLLTYDLINSVSLDIKFSVANGFLYFPLSNNFLEKVRNYGDGKELPTYFRKLEDKRFFYYIN